MQQDRKNYTYIKKASRKERSKMIWTVVLPVAVFFLSIFCVNIFQGIGTVIIAPLNGAMWAVGAASAFYLPSQRKSIITETLAFIAVYNLTLLGFREMIAISSGASAQMLMATFKHPLATATANTIPGYLQNALFASAVMVPIGYIVREGKRVMQFRRNANKQKTMEQLRNIRDVK